MSPIRQGVMEFRRRIEEDPELTATHSFAKIAKQIDKYGDKLLTQMGQTPFAPELQSQADTGHILPGFRKIIILPTLPEHVVRLAAATQQMARSN
jgi:hypothetical protein